MNNKFSERTRAEKAVVLLCCAVFLLTGLLWLDYPGIQMDEALFAAGIYPPFDSTTTVRIFKHDYPAMVMTYVGALKSRLLAPVLSVFRPSTLAIRVPVVVLGFVTVYLFYSLLRRTLGLRPALMGCALLATDPTYVLTTRYDWGPVVLQHVCLMGGLVSLARFSHQRQERWIALGFFLFGLGVWDKALFLWLLIGVLAAAVIAFRSKWLPLVRPRTVAIASIAFLAGTFPLLRYNFRNDWATFRGNTSWEWAGLRHKAPLMRITLEGSGLYGAFFREASDVERAPSTAAERAVSGLNDAFGRPRANLMSYLLLISLLLLPLVWNTPARMASLFSAVFVIITWTQMAIIQGTGGGVHHTILLWPIPLIPPAAVMAELSRKGSRVRRFVPVLLIVIACAANLLVTTTYFNHMIRNGSVPSWTEALDDAHGALAQMDVAAVGMYDWGFWENLRLLSEGRLTMFYASLDDSPENRRSVFEQVSNPNTVFISYVDGSEAVPGSNRRFLKLADSLGYEPDQRRVFRDRNGRDVVQIFRFRSLGGGATLMSMQPQAVRAQDGLIVRNDKAIDAIVPAEAKIEKLADGFKFTEGPIYMRAGHLLFSDIPANTIFRWTHDGNVSEFRKPSGYDGTDAPAGAFVGSNGLTLDKDGRLIVCEHGNRRVTRLENDGRLTVLADRYEGKRLNSPNDAVYKSDGSLYFTDPPYGFLKQDADPNKELPFNGIYRLSRGKLQLLNKDMTRPNGLAFSPDEKFLYVANSDPARKVWLKYPVNADGTLGSPATFFDVTEESAAGLPDGMKVDRNGNVYATGPGGVWIFSPDGNHLGTIKPPEGPANVHWGPYAAGESGSDTLYMTARTGLYRIRLSATGIRP